MYYQEIDSSQRWHLCKNDHGGMEQRKPGKQRIFFLKLGAREMLAMMRVMPSECNLNKDSLPRDRKT